MGSRHLESPERVLVDANIVLRCADPDSPQHTDTVAAIEVLLESGRDLIVTPQVEREFLSVATRPQAVNGMGLSPDEAVRRFDRTTSSFSSIHDLPDHHIEFRRLYELHCPRGKKIHDLNYVATACSHEIRCILTYNAKDFEGPRRHGQIEVLTPDDVLRNVQSDEPAEQPDPPHSDFPAT